MSQLILSIFGFFQHQLLSAALSVIEMSLTIKFDNDSLIKNNVTCHMLPCKIQLNSFCKVSKYFVPYIREEKESLISSLRGYPLQGQKVKVPDNYTGVILKENKNATTEDRELKATGMFNEFVTWNWDKNPSSEDKINKALQWISVASVLHKPIVESDSTSKSPQKQKKRKFTDLVAS